MISTGVPADEMKRILKIKLAGLNVCEVGSSGTEKQVRLHSELLLKLRFA